MAGHRGRFKVLLLLKKADTVSDILGRELSQADILRQCSLAADECRVLNSTLCRSGEHPHVLKQHGKLLTTKLDKREKEKPRSVKKTTEA